jgi:hypothetical protein
LLIQGITLRLEACKKECNFYPEHGKRFHWKNLKNCLRIAQEQEDKEAFHKISTIIQRVQQPNSWHKLNYVMAKKRTCSATSVQVEGQDRAIMEHTTQDTVEQTIFSKIHKKHYTLAGKSPICNGELFQDFSYTANTPALRAVMDGTYQALPNSNTNTKELFAEISAIRQLVQENSISIIITPDQWKQYCKVINEETSSSEYCIHFGHYIVGSKSDIISHYHAS